MNTNIYNVSKRILRFYSVWWVAFLWNSLITYLISDVLRYSYIISVIIVFLFNISIVYVLQKKVTFKAKNVSHTSYLIYVSWVVILMVFLYFWWVYFKGQVTWTYWLASMITMVIITILNFLVQSFLVFGKKDSA